jgi:hypothetical protein
MMAEDRITLDFLAVQQQRLLEEMGLMRTEMSAIRGDMRLMKDDIGVLAAMAQRQDGATKTLLDRIDLLAEQQNRVGDRLRRLEGMQEA